MSGVKIWEENVVIPTYGIGAADKNPMFLESRVYQGSSGRIYPYPTIEKIYDEKEDKTYHAVWLENEYLKVMILPELGGRIQRAYDKTNHYDFVYYNHVIKPALVGRLSSDRESGRIKDMPCQRCRSDVRNKRRGKLYALSGKSLYRDQRPAL